MWPEEFGKEIKIRGILISKKFKEVLVYSYATHTLNYSSTFLMYIVGIGISNVFNQRVRNTQTEEMRTRRPYRAQLLLFYQFDLINDTTSHTSLVSFASLGQHTYNTPAFKKQCSDSQAALKPMWNSLTYLPPITLGRAWLSTLLLLPGQEDSKLQQALNFPHLQPAFPGNAPVPPAKTTSL